MNTITHIALSNDRKNKTRSILIMISIFLSTVLLTVICTCANGMIRSQKANAGLQYGSYYGSFQSVTTRQLKEVERHGEFSTTGFMAGAGMIGSKYKVSVMMADQNARSMSNLDTRLLAGSFAETENEIVADRGFFESLGCGDVAVGDSIRLNYREGLDQSYDSLVFTVSGILKEREVPVEQTAYTVYVSRAFYEAHYQEEDRRYSVLFRLADGIVDNYDLAEEIMGGLAEKCGIAKERLTVNGAYLIWLLDPGYETIMISGFIALIVMILSVVVIYNIFQVGIVQKIQEYGKVRALGATRKQMRSLIFREGMYLALFSIPSGVIAGFAVAWAGLRWLIWQNMKSGGIEDYEMVPLLSVPVLGFAALLAFFTVWVALYRPMRIVAAISPVEAVRYQERTGRRKSGIRKGKKNLSVSSLASANLAASRRRTVTTILTMGLSCVLFVTLANCISNIDSEYEAGKSVPYGQFQLELNYSMRDKAYPENNLDVILKNNPLNKSLVKSILEIPGVTDVRSMDILLAEIGGEKTDVVVFDEENFNRMKGYSQGAGVLDYKDSESEDVIYYCWSHFLKDTGFSLNQKLPAKMTDGTKSCQMEGVLKGSFGSAGASYAITTKQYERLGFSGASPGWLWVDCDQKDVATVRKGLEEVLADVSHVELSSLEDALKMAEFASRTMKVACYLFLGIIGLIGFMNLANTMIMNIITKRQEYGILQAVGMTSRQLNRSLQLQGLLFTAGTAIVAVLAGLPAGMLIFDYARKNSYFGMNVYRVPVLEIVLMVVTVALLQLSLSWLLSRNLKKESLTDRIRYHG